MGRSGWGGRGNGASSLPPVPSRPVPGTAGPRRLLAAPAGGAAPAHLCGGGRGPGRLSRPPPVGGAAGGWFCGGGRDRGRCRWGGTAGTDSPPPPLPRGGAEKRRLTSGVVPQPAPLRNPPVSEASATGRGSPGRAAGPLRYRWLGGRS